MDLGTAIEAARYGNRIARSGWNGADQFVYYVPAGRFAPTTEIARALAAPQPDGLVPYREYLALKTAQGDVATWQPTISDTLAVDWMTV
jgi:hypothetical protein